VLRSLSLLRSCSVIALIVVTAAGCASGAGERYDPRRHGSIKDDPVDGTSAAQPRRATITRVSAPATMVEKSPAIMHDKPTKMEPAPRLPVVEAPAPAVTVRIEQPVAPTVAKPVEAKSPEPKPPEVKPTIVEPAKTAVLVEPPAPQRPLPPKNTETPSSDTRPLTDTRRRSTETAPVTQPAVAVPAAPPTASPAPVVSQPTPPATILTAPPKPEPKAAVDATPSPKIVPLNDEQRVASTLQRADSYMKANRYQDARAVLDDAAKSGNPRLLAALAETYDPLHLREVYPRLVRTGDPEKAVALYEQARAAGARGLDARIQAVKLLAGPKR
jgi:hypothetical protein